MQNAECRTQNEWLEARDPAGPALRIEFLWRGDRFGHAISAVQPDDAVVPLLESIEGISDEDWPASPPLQSLSFATLPDGRRVALLVGMAGRSHWSASIEPAANEGELMFDVACRVSGPRGLLGSRYRVVNEGYNISVESPALVRRGELGEIEIQSAAHSLASATVRWRFAIRLALAHSVRSTNY